MDKKTTDKGWAAMRGLLDREMPEKRRYRFGWWWFGLLLLPIAGYGSWYWLSSTSNSIPGQETAPALLRASAPSAPTYTNATAREQSGQSSAEKGPGMADKSLVTTANENIPNLHKIKNRTAKSLPVLEENSGLTTFENLSNTPAAENTAEKAVVTGHQKIKLNLLPIIPKPIDFQDSKPFSLNAIAIAESPKPVKKTSHKHWAFGAISAISTEQFNTINGFSTGLNVDWKFARKWGLRTGVLYNIHTPQEKYRPVASVLSEDYRSNVYGEIIVVDVATGNELTNAPGSNFGDSLAGKVYIPVNRLQRLEIPLTVFWQAARPLKIVGGLSLTRTLSAKASRQNYSGEYILKLANRTAEDGASKLSSSELDNWSADAMLGAGVQLGSSFELGFSAKMPLSKFPGIANPSQADPNASFAGDRSLGSTRKQNGPVFSLYGTLFF